MICLIQPPHHCMTAATQTLKLSTTLLSVSCGICLISLLVLSLRTSTVCGFFSFRCPPQGIGIWGVGWSGVISPMRNASVPWEVLLEVFNSSVQAKRWCPILLEHHSIHINACLPSQCRNKLFSHHLHVPFCIDSHMIPIIFLK